MDAAKWKCTSVSNWQINKGWPEEPCSVAQQLWRFQNLILSFSGMDQNSPNVFINMEQWQKYQAGVKSFLSWGGVFKPDTLPWEAVFKTLLGLHQRKIFIIHPGSHEGKELELGSLLLQTRGLTSRLWRELLFKYLPKIGYALMKWTLLFHLTLFMTLG